MIKASVNLQDLRRRIYLKAKAEKSWRFWGLYVHVCKMETLREAYSLAKQNDGAPGVDGVTFEAIETQGVDAFLKQIQDELNDRTYVPLPARKQEIPKDGGKVRVLSIPAIRDRVVQGALKLILEPIFEADFQPGSFGYRPKRTAHDAVDRVARAIVQQKTRIIDIDLRSYFDNVRHDRLLAKVARRVDDVDVLHLLKIMLKANGKQGVPQGGVISPLLSNLYLTEVDRMLERAKETTRYGKYTYIEYARFADDLVILIDAHPRHDWLMGAVEKRLGWSPAAGFHRPGSHAALPAASKFRDARGQRLAWIQAHANEFAALNAGILTLDEARRIALGIARLPELMRRPESPDEPLAELFPVVVEVDRGGEDRREEVFRLRTGRLGLDLFEAFVRAFPGCTLALVNGRHRLRLHEPTGADSK